MLIAHLFVFIVCYVQTWHSFAPLTPVIVHGKIRTSFSIVQIGSELFVLIDCRIKLHLYILLNNCMGKRMIPLQQCIFDVDASQ